MWDVLAGSPVTGVKGAKESAYRQGNVEITAENIGALKVGGDVKDTTVTYTSNDSTTAPDATPPALLATGEKLSSLMNKISTLAKNIRWLLGKMGSTDISAIGDGTITGALSTLNSNFKWLTNVPNAKRFNAVVTASLSNISYCIVEVNIPADYQIAQQYPSLLGTLNTSSGLITIASITRYSARQVLIRFTGNLNGDYLVSLNLSITPSMS